MQGVWGAPGNNVFNEAMEAGQLAMTLAPSDEVVVPPYVVRTVTIPSNEPAPNGHAPHVSFRS